MKITAKSPLSEILKIGKECNMCGHCCSYGSGAMTDDDISRIAAFLKITKEDLKKNCLEPIEKFGTLRFRPKLERISDRPYGRCIFLDNDMLCKIDEVKPIECRVGNCKEHGKDLSSWFTINYFIDPDNERSMKEWTIALKTHPTIEGGTPEELQTSHRNNIALRK